MYEHYLSLELAINECLNMVCEFINILKRSNYDFSHYEQVKEELIKLKQ